MMHDSNCLDTIKIQKALELARLMRGQVPEWGSDYIERYIPDELLCQLHKKSTWMDEDGFWWGFANVCAQKYKQTNVISLATKYHGLGTYEHKVLVPPNNSVQVVWGNDLS
jgi:hypothetical protein